MDIIPQAGTGFELRQQAEAILKGKTAQSPEQLKALSPEALGEIFHELHVHQIELELQNEELRQTQLELSAAKARYFDLYDLAPVSYLTVTNKGLISQANLAAATLLGLPRRKLLNKPVSRFVLIDDLTLYYPFSKLLFDSNEQQVLDLRMQNNDGAQFWAHLEAIAAQDADDAPTLRITLSNITERIKTEIALRDSDQFTHAVLNSITSQIAVLDCNGVIIAVNNSWQNFALENGIAYSLSAQHTSVGNNYLEVCLAAPLGGSSDQGQEVYTGIMRVLEGRLPHFSVEYACHSPNQQHWFAMTVTPLGMDNGGVVIVHTNITERKQAERRLSIAAIAFESQDGIIVTDADRTILQVNRSFTNITGYSAEEVIGRNTRVLSSGRHDKAFYAAMWKRINATDTWEGEILNRHKNGAEYLEWLTITAVKNEQGHITNYVATISDITERKNAKEKAKEHLEKLAHVTRLGLMGEMASGIAHEVNQPLAAISTYTQVSLNLINTKNPDLVKLNEVLFKTQQQALRAGGIIHRMKEFGKFHSQKHLTADINRGRTASYPTAPSQIPACGITAQGSSKLLTCTRYRLSPQKA